MSRFVGRARELDELAHVLRAPVGGMALVSGDAGIGKSRLVAEALTDVPFHVAWGSCWQGEGAPAFWPWSQIIRGCIATEAGAMWRSRADPLVDEVAALVPGEGQLMSSDASRFRLFEGVTWLLRAVAATSGLAIVLDDLQWADDASLRLLAFAVRALAADRVVFLGTYRDFEVGPEHGVSALLAELAGRVRHLPLGGLDPEELADFARPTGDDADSLTPEVIADLHRLTGGSPFFAREVLALVRARGQAVGRLQIPAGVRAVIDQRLARLSNACDDALKVAAVIGKTFAVDDLAAAGETTIEETLSVLGESTAAGITVTDADDPAAFRFSHDLLRETIYESMTPVARAASHARVAAALETRRGGEASPASVAHHLIAAVPLIERTRAVEAAMRAGEAASALLAHEEASAWFERSLGLVRADDAGETRALGPLLALGEARLRSGELRRARDAYVEAADIARRCDRPDDLALAALGLGAGLGGFEISLFDHVQIELLEDALLAIPPTDSSRRAQLLARLSVALSFVAEERRLELGREAVAMARRIEDRSTLGYALAAHCDAISGPADSELRRDAAAEVVALGREVRDRKLELLGRRILIVALLELGDFDAADAQIREFSATADAVREPLYRWYVPLWLGMRALMAGHVDESATLCAQAAALGAMAQSANAEMLVLTQEWVRLRVDGRLADAAALIHATATEVFGDLAGSYAVTALGRLHAGDLDAARTRLRDFTDDLARIPVDAEWLPTISQLAEVAAGLEDPVSAAVLDAAMAPFDDRFVVEGIGAAVCGTLGSFRAPLARVLGRDDEAGALAQAAATAEARVGFTGRPRAGVGAPAVVDQTPATPLVGVARREGEQWVLDFAGGTAHVRDSKGLRDLAVLLGSPGTGVHVTELMGGASSSRGQDVLDRRAIAEFRRRLDDLEEEASAAHEQHDEGRAAAVDAEREFLLAELAGAAGLGGRHRRVGDDVDRARKAVRGRVRDAIARIESVHPELGRHLARAVRTGTFCAYDPEAPVRWMIAP